MRKLTIDISRRDLRKIRDQFLVFDTETTCLEPMPKNFVFGCLYGHNVKKVFHSVAEFQAEFDSGRYRKKIIFAHNAEFDLLTVFGNIFLKVDSAAIFNGKFISANYNDITFADSMNIYPTSVEKIGELMNLPKLENKKVKGGKLRTRNVTKEDIKYCFRDCEIVWKALLHIFEMTGTIKITLPALAMHDFRHNYLEEDLFFSELVDEFYDSYYGGRTEAFYIGRCDAKVYDINSMYPFAMANVTLPDVKRLHKVDKSDSKFLRYALEHYEGMATVTVRHKDTYFGYLPSRMKINGTSKLVFPVGEFTTSVNFNELRFAMDRGVIEILKVHKIIYGKRVSGIFTSYIQDNFEKRKATKNTLEKTIYKLKMNSLYGKFAQRIKMTSTYFEQVPYDLVRRLREEKKFCDIKLFSALRADCFLITENEKFKNAFFSIPAISSYITSEARIYLLKNLLQNENNGIVYCDTDSIFLTGSFCGCVSESLGDFKEEGKKIVHIRGLKNYSYAENGKTYDVIKGISKGSVKKGKDDKGNEIYESTRYHKTKGSLRRNTEAGSSYVMVKTLRGKYDKRVVLGSGQTVPLTCKDKEIVHNEKLISYQYEYEAEN